MAQEFDGTQGNVLTDMGFGRLDTAGKMTFLTDQIGSTIALTDNSGAVQTQYSYEPFGRAVASGTSSTNPYQFLFHENDGTGVDYFGRYYSPTFQRFLSEDAAALDGGANSYAYAADQSIDPALAPPNPDLFPGNGSGGESCLYCNVELRWHHAALGLGGRSGHAFWSTDIGGNIQTESGESTSPVGEVGYLNHYRNYYYDANRSNSRTARIESGTAWCPLAFNIRLAGSFWPNDEYSYHFFPGPNSNTVAGFIDFVSGALWGPPQDDYYIFPGWYLLTGIY